MEELELYFEFIKYSSIETIIIPGNHESVKKDTTFLSHLKNVTSSINPLVRIIDDYYEYKGIDFLPYNKLKEYEKSSNKHVFTNSVLVSHVRAEIPPHVKPEVDLSIFDRWQTVLAGDLHSYENSQRNILYPGSPVTTSFHRNVVDTGVILFDTATHTHEWLKLALPQLIRKTIKAGEEMTATDYHHTIYEIEGDMAELGAMADSALIDKKIVKRETDTALILDPKMTMAEELKEYLTYILQLPEDSIESAVETFRSASSKFL
jgi:DNA repair exonuclease SbcCD nuclease subunit